MRLSIVFTFLAITALCSCAKPGELESQAQSQAKAKVAATPESCPYVELQGHFEARTTECTINRARVAAVDEAQVPVGLAVSSLGTQGTLELIFASTNGVSARNPLTLKFPRQPNMDDVKKRGIECANRAGVKMLSAPCPNAKGDCAYSLHQENGKWIGLFHHVIDGSFYSCRLELDRKSL